MEPEPGRHERLEGGSGAAPVPCPDRRREGRETQGMPAAPVPGDGPERREAGLATVRREPEAVDPGPADDGDTPAGVRPGPEGGVRVVPDDGPPGDPASLVATGQPALLVGEVGACRADHRQVGPRACRGVEPGGPAGAGDQRAQRVAARLQADALVRCRRAPDGGEKRAVAARQHQVGLRVADVRGDEERRLDRSRRPGGGRPGTWCRRGCHLGDPAVRQPMTVASYGASSISTAPPVPWSGRAPVGPMAVVSVASPGSWSGRRSGTGPWFVTGHQAAGRAPQRAGRHVRVGDGRRVGDAGQGGEAAHRSPTSGPPARARPASRRAGARAGGPASPRGPPRGGPR